MSKLKPSLVKTAALAACIALPSHAQQPTAPSSTDSMGWLGTEIVKSRFGEFEFKNGYPTPEAAAGMLDQLKLNRAIEVYLTQIPPVAEVAKHRGLADFGAKRSHQVVIWEQLLDATTTMLTANTETIYAFVKLDLRIDGPTVFEAPPKVLGFAMDALQHYLIDIGFPGPDKGQGGKYLFLPPGYAGPIPGGYFVSRSPTFSISFGLRGFQVDGKTDQAVALMKQTKVYPLAKASNPPPMEFFNGSGQPINLVAPDTFKFFEMLARLVDEEPADVFTPSERFYMQAIGIQKDKTFNPTSKDKTLLSEAARIGSAMARANSFASRDPDTYYYPDRKWQYIGDVPYNFNKDGVLEIDRRAYIHYMGIGNSPAMVTKNVGIGSYYLWTYKDSDGGFLEGAQNYKLRIPANVPAKDFWSVVVYDTQSRSELENGEKFPSLSKYTGPKANADGSVDVYFGPTMPPGQEKNWIRTVAGKGWFPFFRFYGPLAPLYDKSWVLSDVEKN